jgi:phospholipase C
VAVSTWTLASAGPASTAGLEGIHKIQHVVMIMQENRSFDSYFGTYPGVNGIPGGVCLPDPQFGGCRAPFYNSSEKNFGGPHGAQAVVEDVDGGKMDGFVKVAETRAKCEASEPYCSPCSQSELEKNARCDDVMGYHDARQVPNYWKYAEKFVLQDNMYESVASWSLPEHLYLVSGWSAVCPHGDVNPMDCANSIEPESPAHSEYGPVIPGKTTYSWTDLPYLLDKHSVSWRYFIFEGDEPDCESDEAVECVHKKQSPLTPGIWNPLPDFTDVKEDGQLGNIQSLENFYTDVEEKSSCGLPNVSWVVPNQKVSEHPRSLISSGQTYVTTLINSIMRSPCWGSTAILLSWDDWGGFYDNAVPPDADQNGYGIRVPGLVISPYAKAGYIDKQQLSHDAYLKFIEDDFVDGQRLNPATDGRPDERPDAREEASGLGNLSEDFDFNQTPRAPLLLSPDPAPGPPSKAPGTAQQPPTVKTGEAALPAPGEASLSGTIDPNLGIVSQCFFEYGTSTSYGSSAQCASLPEYGEATEQVSAQVQALKAGTTYYYRLVAGDNVGQSAYGQSASFKTTGGGGGGGGGDELPQIGRCVQSKGATGRFTDAACTKLSAGEDSGAYEWQPDALARGIAGKLGATKLGSAGKLALKCKSGRLSGSVAGATSVSATIVLEGCATAKGKTACQTHGASAGTIDTEPLEGTLGFIAGGEAPTVGLDLHAAGDGALDSYECSGANGARISEHGSVIGSTTADAMSKSLPVSFAVEHDAQQPQAFEGEPADVLEASVEASGGGSSEASSTLKAKVSSSLEEALEIKAVP